MKKAQPVQMDMIAALTLATPAPDGGDKPRLLDLYCCSGGVGRGYLDVGFDVTGVDIVSRPAYPARFIQSDAVDYLIAHGHEYDAVHASPECQGFSWATPKASRGQYGGPEIFAEIREVCEEYGLPLIMENVRDARGHLDLMTEHYDAHGSGQCEPMTPNYVRGWREPIMLCGEMFGLGVLKHRYFEVGGIAVPQPEHLKHRGTIADGTYVTTAGHGADNPKGGSSVARWQEALGIDWVYDRHELAEAIPPAYGRFLGAHLMAWL